MTTINQTTAKIIMLSCFSGAAASVPGLLNALQDSEWPSAMVAFGHGMHHAHGRSPGFDSFNELLKALGRLRP